MRKNSVRKFIHAILDLLPLLIIPIFAININQKSVEPIQVEVQENLKVDFNQYVNYENYYFDLRDFVGTNASQNNYVDVNGTISAGNIIFIPLTDSTLNLQYGDKFIVSGFQTLTGMNILLYNGTNVISLGTNLTGVNQCNITYRRNWQFYANRGHSGTIEVVGTPMIFNLTQMYGSGNEPTYEEFMATFNDNYYEYTESQKMLVNKPTTTTYDETDIGSQFLYSLYIPVHDYFNFNNLFNMGAIYDWIQLNLFSGTAPLPVFIIWNIIVYEFFVDLIFLLYSVFMFVIDFTTNTIDSFVNKSRRL